MTTDTFSLDPVSLRAQFPALQLEVNGETAVFLDGPGGTQSPQRVLEAMSGYLAYGSSNLGGPFRTSQHADHIVQAASENNIPVALVHLVFNGPDGEQDPILEGYLINDGLHPSELGATVIADLHQELGYEYTCR